MTKIHKDETARTEPKVKSKFDQLSENLTSEIFGGTIRRSQPTLSERGISRETREHFGLQSGHNLGQLYKVTEPNGLQGRRVMGMSPNIYKFGWAEHTKSLPVVYNAINLDSDRHLFIVQNDLAVWTMHENKLQAVCILNFDHGISQLAEYLKSSGIRTVSTIFNSMPAGRVASIRIRTELKKFGINATILSLEDLHIFDPSELFLRMKYNSSAFCEAIETLPRVYGHTLEEWRADPEDGLTSEGSQQDALALLGESDLESLPHPKCVIEGVLLAGRPSLLTGQHNTGKTAIALDMSWSICTGRPWCGRQTTQGDVIYIAAEGAGGIAKRLKAWKKFHGIAEMPNFSVVPRAVQIHDPEQRTCLIDMMYTLREWPALIVIDTLARCSAGLAENDTDDMTIFTNAAEEICQITGAAVLIVHHNNRGHGKRTDAFRGSSALPANCDGHLALSGDTGSEKVKLFLSKVKDFADGTSIALRRQIVTLDSPKKKNVKSGTALETSVVFVYDGKADAGNQLSPKEQAVLDALLSNVTESEDGFVAVTSAVWSSWAAKDRVASATFERAKKKLVDVGAVVRIERGKQRALFAPYSEDFQEAA